MRALVRRPLPSAPAQGADVASAARRLAGEIILLMPDTPAPRG
jgi:hypothetical protein